MKSPLWFITGLLLLLAFLNVIALRSYQRGESAAPPDPTLEVEDSCARPWTGGVCSAADVPQCWAAAQVNPNPKSSPAVASAVRRGGAVYVFTQNMDILADMDVSCAFYDADAKPGGGSTLVRQKALAVHRPRHSRNVPLVVCPVKRGAEMLSAGVANVAVSVALKQKRVACPDVLAPSTARLDLDTFPLPVRHKKKRHHVCVCSVVAPHEQPYAREFAEYALALGAEHVFLYSAAPAGLKQALRTPGSVARPVGVSVFGSPPGEPELHCVMRSEAECRWTLVTGGGTDALVLGDEFKSIKNLVWRLEKPPPEMLGRSWYSAPLGDVRLQAANVARPEDDVSVGVAYVAVQSMGEANHWRRPRHGGLMENLLYTGKGAGASAAHAAALVRTDALGRTRSGVRYHLADGFYSVLLDESEALAYRFARVPFDAGAGHIDRQAFGWGLSQRCDTRLRDAKRARMPHAAHQEVGDAERVRNPFCEPGFCCPGDEPERYHELRRAPGGRMCIGNHCAPPLLRRFDGGAGWQPRPHLDPSPGAQCPADHPNMRRALFAVTTFNHWDMTLRLWNGIQANGEAPAQYEMVLFDDASTDGTPAKARELGIRVEENPGPRGVTFTWNAAYRVFKRECWGYFIVANNDIIVPRRAIPNMMRALDDNPDIGLLGPMATRQGIGDNSMHDCKFQVLEFQFKDWDRSLPTTADSVQAVQDAVESAGGPDVAVVRVLGFFLAGHRASLIQSEFSPGHQFDPRDINVHQEVSWLWDHKQGEMYVSRRAFVYHDKGTTVRKTPGAESSKLNNLRIYHSG